MKYIDCFNGDADGVCALIQIRLANPQESELITGVKRDINLLKRVKGNTETHLTALDISMDKNKDDLLRILGEGASVFYCDHHFAGEVPDHGKLEVLVNTTSDVCTSLLVNKYLDSRFLDWAVVGTYGDNLKRSASVLAKPLNLSEEKLEVLENLGIYMNYNGYGASLDDLYFHPADLYRRASAFKSAFDFIESDFDTFGTLENGYHEDMAKAAALAPTFENLSSRLYVLPNAPWARRVSGVYSNDLANASPDQAHAVLTEKEGGGYLVSVRAPLNNKFGADEICRQFDTGGGRAAAAGVNHLNESDYQRFEKILSEFYS